MRHGIILTAWILSAAAFAQELPPADEPAPAPASAAGDAVVSDAPPAPAEEGAIYRSVGADGSIVFSDKPSPGATKVEMQEAQTIEAPPPPSFVYERPQPEPGPAYTRVEIVEPANDAQIRENTGNVTISVAVEPSLSGGDLVVLLMDGQEVAAGPQSSFNLENVDRGTHVVSVAIRTADGRAVTSSPPVTFHMLRYFEPPPKPAPKPKPKPK